MVSHFHLSFYLYNDFIKKVFGGQRKVVGQCFINFKDYLNV